MPVLPDVGEVFSGCEILARCGNGAYGITFLARNPLGQKVIIKIVGNLNSGERELAGLRNYMRAATRNPDLLQIYHIGEHEDGFYYTMEAADNIGSGNEYIPATLGNLFRQKKRFTPEEAVAIIRGTAAGLQIIHNAGLIHRDIKPDNIIFVNGKPKLSDPGLVISIGEQASFAGTPGFIPPELLSGGGSIDQQADIYALGKVFYCLVTGQPPKLYPNLPENMRIEVCRQIYPALIKMCNRNPEKRCKNVEELLDILPVTFKKPTLFERWYEDFRAWKQLNDKLYKRCKYALIFILLLAFTGTGTFCYWQYRNSCYKKHIMQQLADFRKINCERQELVLLQLETYLPEKVAEYKKLHAILAQAERSGKYLAVAANLEKFKRFLVDAALQLLPDLPDESAAAAVRTTASGNMHGFLAAPLAEYLPAGQKDDLQKRLKKFDAVLYRNWEGLRCGQDLEEVQYYYIPLKFVPPGAVKMYHSQKNAVIPYHFWISKNEVMGEDVTRKIGISPQLAPGSSNPVERISWNDILYYCYTLTNILRSANMLPENYIVRPPTEVEWEYAANNGWLGKDTSPLTERASLSVNSQKRPWPAGRLLPNKLGLNDIYGNVSEIVQAVEPPAMQQSTLVRGGSFSDTPARFNRRIEYLKYQNIPYNIGFRVAVAPGDMSYFDREFFLGGPVQASMRGKVYELIGANMGVFKWHQAEELCRLLGGRLAEIEDKQHLTDLRKALPLLGKWETLLGGTRENDQWLWQYSRNKIDFGSWVRTQRKDDEKHLTLVGNRFDRTKDRKAAIFLCEWDAENFDKRNRQLADGGKLPFELCRFDYKGNRYVLFQISGHWLTAKRICELLGGALACLDDAAVRKQVMKELEPYQTHRIILGGYCKRDKWYWLNGKLAETPMRERLNLGIPTANLNCITLHNNMFFNSQSGCMFLCEWRLNSASSH